MLIVRNSTMDPICARCGKTSALTIDHFIPKCCRMTVNTDGNFVGICRECNQEKGCQIVTPEWYKFLNKEQKKTLDRYMRYASSYIVQNTSDEEVLAYVKALHE